MGDDRRFRTDLYKGTAEHYDLFRRPYPPAMLDDLRMRVPLGCGDRLVDLACGTGQIAFALAGSVAAVVAVDQESEAIDFGSRKARHLGVHNIEWVNVAAEEVALKGEFQLVAVGNAFHRLDRNAVVRLVTPHLADRGCIALLWSDTPWRGDQRWQLALADSLERWQVSTGARDRIPEGLARELERDPHEAVLRRAGLSYEGVVEYSTTERWSVESLIGFVYSTSFLNRSVLAARTDEFEDDVRSRLLASCPEGVFERDATSALELARLTERS